MIEIRDTFRDAEIEASRWRGMWRGRPPHPTKGSGGVSSSPSGVRGRSPAENGFGAFFSSTECISDRQNVKVINYIFYILINCLTFDTS